MLSLSSRPWLGYSDMGRYNLTPLSYEALDYASGMCVSPYLAPCKLDSLIYVLHHHLLLCLCLVCAHALHA